MVHEIGDRTTVGGDNQPAGVRVSITVGQASLCPEALQSTCPTCGMAFVRYLDGGQTCVGFYSPEGHDHDDNCIKRYYVCPQGHETKFSLRRSCPACDWKGQDPLPSLWTKGRSMAKHLGYGCTISVNAGLPDEPVWIPFGSTLDIWDNDLPPKAALSVLRANGRRITNNTPNDADRGDNPRTEG